MEEPAWYPHVDWEARHQRAQKYTERSQSFRRSQEEALDYIDREHPSWPTVERAPWVRAQVDVDEGFIASAAGFVDEPWNEIAAAIRRPTLHLTGEHGNFDDADRRLFRRAAAPAVRIEMLAGVGHYTRRDDARLYHSVVDAWLRQIVGRGCDAGCDLSESRTFRRGVLGR